MSRLASTMNLPKRLTFVIVAAIVFCTAGSVYAMSEGGPGGEWPKSWPKELEPLRKQAWTWEHELAGMSYDIAFANREQFESAWPHILKVKGKGAPITLLRGRHVRVLTAESPKGKTAGVRIMVPREITPAKAEGRPVGSRAVATEPPFVSRPSAIGHPTAPVPLPAAATPPATPSETDFAGRSAGISILLVVDGNIVDLNRIRLPPDTPIVDRRFEK